jgi:hypothetical protein
MPVTYLHIEDASNEEYDLHSKEYCSHCGFKKPTVEEQYSFGVYAGRLCRECAISGYRDACGLLDGNQGDPNDLDEPLDEDDYAPPLPGIDEPLEDTLPDNWCDEGRFDNHSP